MSAHLATSTFAGQRQSCDKLLAMLRRSSRLTCAGANQKPTTWPEGLPAKFSGSACGKPLIRNCLMQGFPSISFGAHKLGSGVRVCVGTLLVKVKWQWKVKVYISKRLMQYKAVLVDFTQENIERKVVSQRKHYLRLKGSLMHKITFPILIWWRFYN